MKRASSPIVFAFHETPRMALPITGLSFRWFEQVYDDPQVRQTLTRSVFAAIITAAEG